MRQYEAMIVGFALSSCKLCKGTGRLGWNGPTENGIVNPCPCVVFFEKSTLLKEADEQREQRDSGVVKARQREGNTLPGVAQSGNEGSEGRK